jgi:hypothetical protein
MHDARGSVVYLSAIMYGYSRVLVLHACFITVILIKQLLLLCSERRDLFFSITYSRHRTRLKSPWGVQGAAEAQASHGSRELSKFPPSRQ